MTPVVERNGDKVKVITARLVLRGAREEDAESLHEVFGNPEVMKYWSEPPHQSTERTREWVAGMMNAAQNGTTDFVIILKETGKPIGKIGIWQQDEIGYLLNAACWRKGLAREALNALLPYFFGEKGFKVISADTDPENTASIALLQNFGFEVTGFEKNTFKIGDKWVDSCYLRLLKEKWGSLAELCDLAEKDAGLV